MIENRSFVDVSAMPDLEFDSIYEARIRRLSAQHWTPVRVAARAAQLLTRAGARHILDVGSGVGKFCIVGALTTDAHFVGVERRLDLVEIARGAAAHLGATRAAFVHDNVDVFPFTGFDGFYLYNPFHEQINREVSPIDGAFPRSNAAYRRFIDKTTKKLSASPSATAVVMFNGYGGTLSREYTFRGDEPAGNDWLELWTKD
ncbi:MAG TPA: methyltransferase domain-containing protein [Polyangia bacterium]|jgi:predicted RNA methylase|nr:methyltransferase domain-containing protein [Polyangia bacterium]